MGVRVSSFHDARVVLGKGQKQLGQFFGATTSELVPTAIGATLPASESLRSCITTRSCSDPPTAVCDRPVTKAGTSSTDTKMVRCPVCGADVPANEADFHVNAHYDMPSALQPKSNPSSCSLSVQHVFSRWSSPAVEGHPVKVPETDLTEEETDEDCVWLDSPPAMCDQPVTKAGTSSTDTEMVRCPVCGRDVPAHEADCHVNAHYDMPSALLPKSNSSSGSLSIQHVPSRMSSPAVEGHPRGVKRKTSDLPAKNCGVLPWPVRRLPL